MMKVSHSVSFFTRIRVTAGLLVLWFLVAPASFVNDAKAQSGDARPRSTVAGSQQDTARGQSTVRGRAVFDDTGQPAPRQRVQLIAARVLENPDAPLHIVTAITNEQGDFNFAGIAAGEYYVVARSADERVASAESFPVPRPTGDAAADSAKLEQFKKDSTKISVDGRSSIEVNLRVANPHFGVISGYVSNANGDVAVRARVSCISKGGRASGASVLTNERGAYRFENLPAGDYTVSADPPPREQQGDRAPISPTQSFISTFYPSTTDSGSSVTISVFPGQETPGINITLIERSAHKISGTVKTRASGEPVAYIVVRLSPTSGANRPSANGGQIDPGPQPQVQLTDRDGRWSFSNVPDGGYIITVEARQLAPPANDAASPPTLGRSPEIKPKFGSKRQEVTVAGADLPDLTIELSAGGRISGSVVVEGDKPLPQRIGIMAGAKDGTQPPSSATVQADGSFTLSGVPEGEVSLIPQLRPPNTFYVKAIEANGVDLLRERLKIDEGTEIRNVRVVISSAVAVLTGHVFASQGRTPLSRAAIFLVPVDPEKRNLPSTQFTSMTNPDGTFLIGAAPGDYIVVAWKSGDPPPLNPEALAANTLRITLQAGERRSMDIVK